MSPNPIHDPPPEQPLIQPVGRHDQTLGHELWIRYGLAPGLIAQKDLLGLGLKGASPINRNTFFLGDIQRRWRTNNDEGNWGQALFRYAMASPLANDPLMKEPTAVVSQTPRQTATSTVQSKDGVKDGARVRVANGIQKENTPKTANMHASVVKASASKNISTSEKQGHSPLSFSIQRKIKKERVSAEMSPTQEDSAKQKKHIDRVDRILPSDLVLPKKTLPPIIQRQAPKSQSQETPSRATASARLSNGDSSTVEMQPPLFLARSHRRQFTESDFQTEGTGIHRQGHNHSMPPMSDQISDNVSSPSGFFQKPNHEVPDPALPLIQPKVGNDLSGFGSRHHEFSPKLVLQRQVAMPSISGKPPVLFPKREREESSLATLHISRPQDAPFVESRKKMSKADHGQLSMLPPAIQTKGNVTGQSAQSGTRAFYSGTPSPSNTSLVFRTPLGGIKEGVSPVQCTTTNESLHRSELPEMRAAEQVDVRSESPSSDFIDVDDLTEQVWQKLSRHFRIKRERKGRNVWL